jgi:hypothetical protein
VKDNRRIELLACAMWAKQKCTTSFGIDIEAWENMQPMSKLAWINLAKEHLANFRAISH